ncbi:MAG TPA: GTPase ObgE [Dehalococcoidales bacterium]|nr:GTPase ObgE [Dehalococcoidales bacterium]
MYDIVKIRVQAGDGGDGAITFRHEKYVPYGGPDGGDGGKGGDVVLKIDPSVTDFKMFHNGGLYKAERGHSGQGSKKFGKQGEDLIIGVPVGTTIYEDTGEERRFLADLGDESESVIVAEGGRGGRGNVHFATSTMQTPRLAEAGDKGEFKTLFLELRLIADVGIIGYPNVGKSSLLAAASRAHPKIADYAFTTREPELGVVDNGINTFVLAEIPGLIEGASQGKGLGYDFLRHSTRTRVFIHLIDGTSASPTGDMVKVNNELYLYDPDLLKRPQIAVINKIDIPDVRNKIEGLKNDFAAVQIPVKFVSAANGEGIPELLKDVAELLRKQAPEPKPEPEEIKVFRPTPSRQPRARLNKKGTIFYIDSHEVERIVSRVDMTDPTVTRQVRALLTRKHITPELESLGIQGGDKVRCGQIEWEW